MNKKSKWLTKQFPILLTTCSKSIEYELYTQHIHSNDWVHLFIVRYRCGFESLFNFLLISRMTAQFCYIENFLYILFYYYYYYYVFCIQHLNWIWSGHMACVRIIDKILSFHFVVFCIPTPSLILLFNNIIINIYFLYIFFCLLIDYTKLKYTSTIHNKNFLWLAPIPMLFLRIWIIQSLKQKKIWK